MSPIKSYTPENIRNVSIVGHGHSGKTSLVEAILFDEGATTRLGSTAAETSTLDFEPEEVHRKGSIFSHFGWVEHRGKKINLIDTPGDQNFFLDGLTALLGADSIVAVVSSVSGAGLQAKRAWNTAVERKMARVIFINKMDRAASPWRILSKRIGQSLQVQPIEIQIPIGSGETFRGVVDLFSMKALLWNPDGSGKMKTEEIPEELNAEVEAARAEMVESIVSTDDVLLEKYLSDGSVTEIELRNAFSKAVCQRKVVPLLFGSATLNMGVQPLLDLMEWALPSPIDRGPLFCKDLGGKEEESFHDPEHPFLAQVIHTGMDEHAGQLSILRVFSGELPKDGNVLNSSTGETLRLGTPFVLRGRERTRIDQVICGDIITAVKLKNTHTNNTLCAPNFVHVLQPMTYPKPMISYVVLPETKNDEDKLKVSIDRLMEEDPTLSYSHDEVSRHLVLHGMGHGHLESAIERMKRRFQVTVKTELPPVAYRETFAKPVRGVEGKHKKQTGGAGQFGICFIDVEPVERNKGFEFVNDIYGGSIPKSFIPAVEKGVVECAKHGALAGYPVVDFRVSLKDGKHHPVDSKDIAFQMAGWKALKIAMKDAGMKLLEPYYKMEIVIPTENAGDIMKDIAGRRGHVDGMENVEQLVVIHATCPLVEVQRYLPDLRSMTGGKGSFVMEFDAYRDVPGHLADRICKESPFKKQASAEEGD